MIFSPLIEQLIEALRCLPGVGPKSAQRMAIQLLERNRSQGSVLAKALETAMSQVNHCQRCRILSELNVCQLCDNHKRDQTLLCVVESPSDVMAIEQTHSYSGLYFVLRGHLSPIDGMGPQEIGIDLLAKRLEDEIINEIILATNPTVEGEATAHYIAHMIQGKPIRCTRIAHGVPMGGELEYLDGNTLSSALRARTVVA